MIEKFRHLGFIRRTIMHEPEEVVLQEITKRRCAHTTIVSYVPLELPNEYSLGRVKNTPIIPLKDKSLSDVKSGFKASTRNQVNKSTKIEKLHFQCGDGGIKKSFQLCNKLECEQGRGPFSWKQFKDLHACNAYYNDRLISTIAYIESYPVLRVFQIASIRMDEENDKEFYRLVAIAGKRLVYELCKFGINRHFEQVDLAYINTNDPTKRGINEYKMQFGSIVVQEYRYVYKSKIFCFFETFSHITRALRTLIFKSRNLR